MQVKEVLPGSESALNNVQIGDRILWVGNQNVSTSLYNDITSRLNSSQRPLTITFIREQEHCNQGQQNPLPNASTAKGTIFESVDVPVALASSWQLLYFFNTLGQIINHQYYVSTIQQVIIDVGVH